MGHERVINRKHDRYIYIYVILANRLSWPNRKNPASQAPNSSLTSGLSVSFWTPTPLSSVKISVNPRYLHTQTASARRCFRDGSCCRGQPCLFLLANTKALKAKRFANGFNTPSTNLSRVRNGCKKHAAVTLEFPQVQGHLGLGLMSSGGTALDQNISNEGLSNWIRAVPTRERNKPVGRISAGN